MWRVQTEGYKDGEGMLIGTVAPNIDDSPDGEFISGGVNSKGPNSMAIGRQGSYLHWGFAASPTYMTEEAKLVFVNSIHYIKKFAGQQAHAKKAPVMCRDSIDSILYKLSDQGNDIWAAYTKKSAIADEKVKEELRERQKNGETLSRFEESRLAWESPPWNRMDALSRLPEEIRNEMGDDVAACVKYLENNRPYFYGESDGWFTPMKIDEDAKALGIPNNDFRILEKCITLIEQEPKNEIAFRILKRYTNQDFATSQQWKKWLADRRDYLFFSEPAGFKFSIDVNKVIADGKQQWLVDDKNRKLQQANEANEKLIDAISVAQPKSDNPVAYKCELVKLKSTKPAGSEIRFRVIAKFKILDGWHLYSDVPVDEPYNRTTLKVEAPDGIKVDDEWNRTPGHPSRENPKISIWENECVLYKDIVVRDESKIGESLTLTINYQVCNEESCLRPQTDSVELKIGE
ncbi:MAG: protein-disulfide reductase DsbD domain-containing protein [Mariniblastus sp.]